MAVRRVDLQGEGVMKQYAHWPGEDASRRWKNNTLRLWFSLHATTETFSAHSVPPLLARGGVHESSLTVYRTRGDGSSRPGQDPSDELRTTAGSRRRDSLSTSTKAWSRVLHHRARLVQIVSPRLLPTEEATKDQSYASLTETVLSSCSQVGIFNRAPLGGAQDARSTYR